MSECRTVDGYCYITIDVGCDAPYCKYIRFSGFGVGCGDGTI